MKTKFILIVAMIFAMAGFQQAHSQTPVYLGLKAGIGIPNLHTGNNGSEVSSGYSSRLGPYFGVFGEFRLSDKFSIQPEINYSSQGGKKDGEQAVPAQQFEPSAPAGMMVYANYKSVAKLNYVEVPVLAKFTFPLNSHFNFMVDAGPYVGFLFKAANVTSGSSNVYADKEETQPLTPGEQNFNANTDIKNQLKSTNFGIQGGVGFSYNLNNGYIFIHGGGNYGLVDIQKNAQDGKNNTGAATVVLGYALRIN